MYKTLLNQVNGLRGVIRLLEDTGLNDEQLELVQMIKGLTDTLLTTIKEKEDQTIGQVGSMALHSETKPGTALAGPINPALITARENQAGTAGPAEVLTESAGTVKVLLVEDNKVNEMFVVKILKARNIACDVASDGLKAITACAHNRYDLVLMDCQMPVMDGYEATRRIRQQEGGRRHTPIIAMTAFAMSGDAEKCKAAGMDDYLSKPIVPDKLMHMIQRYTEKQAEDLTDKLTLLDRIIDRFVAETGLEKIEARVLFDESIPSIKKTLDDAQSSIQAGNMEKGLEYLHQIKGATGNLRMNEIAEKLREAELAGQAKEVEKLNAMVAELGQMLGRLTDLTG